MRRFREDMDEVVSDTTDMGRLVSDMIARSVRSICDGDTATAGSVIGDFDIADGYDNSIEEKAVRIMTLYQPTAEDTRTVATVLKCITYLERIAKYSRNIAVATKYLADKPRYGPLGSIGPMGEVAVEMVRLATDCFGRRTVEGLGRIAEMDDYLDGMMKDCLMETVEFMRQHPDSADVCTYCISVVKYLERVGDHACKIAEKVTFMVTGEKVRIS